MANFCAGLGVGFIVSVAIIGGYLLSVYIEQVSGKWHWKKDNG